MNEELKNAGEFVLDNWGVLVPIVYEVGARVIPTEKNRSLLDLLVRVIGLLIKNRRKKSTYDETPIDNDKVNKIIVDRSKHVIYTLLFLLSFGMVSAQTNSTFKSARSYNADSLTVQTEISGLQLMYGNVGGMYFNTTSAKWRCYATGTGWYDCLSSGGGGGGLLTASNGLTATGTNVKLGGSLIENTAINGGFTYTMGLTTPLTSYSLFTTSTINLTSSGGSVGISPSTDMNISAGDDFVFNAIDDVGITSTNGDINIQAASGNAVLQATTTAQVVGNNTLLTGSNSVGIEANSGDVTIDASGDIIINSEIVRVNTSGTGAYLNVDNTLGNEIGFFGYVNGSENTYIQTTLGATEIAYSNGTNTSAFGVEAQALFALIDGNSGSSGEFLGSDGLGKVGWFTPSGGGSPAGSNTQIQFNNSGAFGANAGMTFVAASEQLRLGNTPATNGVIITGLAASNPNVNVRQTGLGGASLAANSLQFGGPSTISTSSSTLDISAAGATTVIQGANTDLTLGSSGPGTGDVTIRTNQSTGSYLFITNIPTTCSGVPSGAIAAVSGVLTVCP